MTKEEKIQSQIDERENILKLILESDAKKKLIVAGAGTGKTFTFGEILKQNPNGTNLVMTFIRLLRDDMFDSLGDKAEVRTFHEFCKKILHQTFGSIELYPNLTRIVEEDANHFGKDFNGFSEKFQTLEEDSEEIKFYLKRGDYYKTVSFNDSVYRMLLALRENPEILNEFDQILIDEYQDFNRLEVEFINEIEKFGSILIVGDDDQAVYDFKNASPNFLKEKHKSGKYQTFQLPFCIRCPEAIVESNNSILASAEENGLLNGRIEKPYECFIDSKDSENEKFPTITTAKLSTAKTLSKYIKSEIAQITEHEIEESWKEGSEYPTVLIVGSRQYLNFLFKNLKVEYENITFKQSENYEIKVSDGYSFLLSDEDSNIGWRILMRFFLSEIEMKSVLFKTIKSDSLIKDLLDKVFVKEQKEIVSLISKLCDEEIDDDEIIGKLKSKLADFVDEIVSTFQSNEDDADSEKDKSEPSILLTSFQGCKGLSAGFTFIVGFNNGVIPVDINNITDVEVCKLIVALTRTRKKAYLLSEDRMYGPKDKSGNWIPKNERSIFIDWIPDQYLEDLGNLKAGDIA